MLKIFDGSVNAVETAFNSWENQELPIIEKIKQSIYFSEMTKEAFVVLSVYYQFYNRNIKAESPYNGKI